MYLDSGFYGGLQYRISRGQKRVAQRVALRVAQREGHLEGGFSHPGP